MNTLELYRIGCWEDGSDDQVHWDQVYIAAKNGTEAYTKYAELYGDYPLRLVLQLECDTVAVSEGDRILMVKARDLLATVTEAPCVVAEYQGCDLYQVHHLLIIARSLEQAANLYKSVVPKDVAALLDVELDIIRHMISVDDDSLLSEYHVGPLDVVEQDRIIKLITGEEMRASLLIQDAVALGATVPCVACEQMGGAFKMRLSSEGE